jgi:16S rRNA (guanine527-N7)-methyltransferase
MQIILKYFPSLTHQQIAQYQELQELYSYWNERINVISRKDIGQLYERHVLHSLAIAKFFQFPDNSKILDIGTGGGFPGIPLAIMFPNVNFTLADSIGKKITVVNEICKSIKLKNVSTINVRAENIENEYHFIVSRAVTDFAQFVRLAGSKIKPGKINETNNGIIYLKGGDFINEIKKFGQKVKVYDISDFFIEEFFETKKIIYLPA